MEELKYTKKKELKIGSMIQILMTKFKIMIQISKMTKKEKKIHII